MPAVPMSVPRQQFLDDDGVPVALGWLYTYEAGTSTPSALYTNHGRTVAYANPIHLDAAGRIAGVAYPPADTALKYVLKDADFVTIWTADYISPAAVETA